MIAMADAIRISQRGQSLELQVEGRGTMQQSPALRRCVEGRVARGVNSLRIDLSRCSHFDSTFIGTLLMLNRRLMAAAGKRILLSAPSPACSLLLVQMHVRDQFDISIEKPAPCEWQEELPVDANAPTSYGFKENVVEAHQALAQLDGPAGEQFRELAAHLAKELPPPPKRPGSLHDTIQAE